MTRLMFGLALVCALTAQAAQLGPSPSSFCAGCGIWGSDTFVSHSKQFVVHGNAGAKLRGGEGTNAMRLINLEPQIFAVTAERAKRALLQELGVADEFRDKIHGVVVDRMRPDSPIQLVSEVYSDGFQYRIGVPGRLEHTRLIRVLVQALLLEYANRGSKRCAELPRWLVEGMTRQVLSSTVPTYVLNESRSAVEILGYDRLSYTRDYLSTNRPMTVQELSFYNGSPAEEQRFAACAHMLVHELLEVRGGRTLMTRFLRALPRALNWQTAFYQVYGAHFSGALDFEKWWMLAWTDQKNRPGQEIWPVETGLTRLHALLLTSMETRSTTNNIPERREATLQEVLAQAEFGMQRAIFSQKVQQLFFASVNLPEEVLPLAQAYQETLERYVQKRAVNQYQPGLKYDPEQRTQLLVQATMKNLDELDRARQDLMQGRQVGSQRPGRR
jgi:hypothetical protein